MSTTTIDTKVIATNRVLFSFLRLNIVNLASWSNIRELYTIRLRLRITVRRAVDLAISAVAAGSDANTTQCQARSLTGGRIA
ncbi:MAG: hypothetical protein KAT39_12980, partial [Alphaproteobacteria bacterium]|nr:hypothetical protein [Alphaproteobacteria bacterium]